MAKKYALLVGLDKLHKDFYGGNDGSLCSPTTDTIAMSTLIKKEGYQDEYCKLLLNEAATKSAFLNTMLAWQQQLVEGDLLVITFSGHGGRLHNTDSEEKDPGEGKYDETLCFYDGQISDDIINELLAGFRKGVRIFVISDSCYSGTVIKDPNQQKEKQYQPISTEKRKPILASVLLISSTQENKLAYDGEPNSQFMTVLLKVWDEGRFEGTYRTFFEAIKYAMPDWNQRPNWLMEGVKDEGFVARRPFS